MGLREFLTWLDIPPGWPFYSDPIGVTRSDYLLEFTVPNNLMPDVQLAGKKAFLRVHRVTPSYRWKGLKAKHAMVLIHGRSLGGSVSFDMQHPAPDSESLSLQEKLALAGIDTFAPDLLGYGLSTRFSLDEPGNASRPAPQDATRHPVIFPLEQQDKLLKANPLNQVFKPHTSKTYFANNDVWARDIMQVVDDALRKSGLKKVALLGYSAGGPRVGKIFQKPADAAKISHAVLLSALFNALFVPDGMGGLKVHEAEPPDDEVGLTAHEKSTTFSLTLMEPPQWDRLLKDAPDSASRIPPGAEAARQAHALAQDPLGASWGGTVYGQATTGLLRSPTYTNSGWNSKVAKTVTIPTLILHGTSDGAAPVEGAHNLYKALTVPGRTFVEFAVASHSMHYETAANWKGPHHEVAAAITEWAKSGTYRGYSQGRWKIDGSGVRTKL